MELIRTAGWVVLFLLVCRALCSRTLRPLLALPFIVLIVFLQWIADEPDDYETTKEGWGS